MPAVNEAHETSRLFVPPSLCHAALSVTQQVISSCSRAFQLTATPVRRLGDGGTRDQPQRDSLNSSSAWGNLAVPIWRTGTEDTYVGSDELEARGDEKVHSKDKRPLSCLHAGWWASTFMHVCVRERVRKCMSPRQRGGAAPDD